MLQSRPTRGAWVEIRTPSPRPTSQRTSRPTRGAWVEIFAKLFMAVKRLSSRPTRGAWVEINKGLIYSNMGIVAPRKGRVG